MKTFQLYNSIENQIIILWDAALVRSSLGSKFRPMYGICANPESLGIWVATDL